MNNLLRSFGISPWQVITGLVAGSLFVVMLYLSSIFARKADVEARFAPLDGLPPRVTAIENTMTSRAELPMRVKELEKWEDAQQDAQTQDGVKFSTIQADLSAIRAQQAEKAKNDDINFKRILNKLDTLH